tara:strand:- start:2860 stop:3075 length:216 start_codon:yes stop_codon:yes gene_type:complete
MNDDRGELDLTRQIDELTIRLDSTTKVLETLTEENANLKIIISKLQEEKLTLQKQLHDTQHQLNILEYQNK